MERRPFFRAIGSALVFAFAMASCEHTGQFEPVPDAPRFSTESSEGSESYTLLQDRIPSDIPNLDVSKLIGIEGGQISLAGHKLTVPAGAVEVPTLFTMTLKTTGYVDVDLSATVTDLLGNVIDVGENGFKKEVTLTLTFARSPNAPSDADEMEDITLMRMQGDTHEEGHEALETEVDTETRTASAKLDHFSGYCLADN